MTNTPFATSTRPLEPSTRRVAAWCALLSLGALVAFARDAGAAGSGVLLRYGLKPGAGYQQAASMTLDMVVDPSSLPAGLAPLVQSMAGGMQQEIVYTGLLELKDRAADGVTPFGFKVVAAHGSFTRSGQKKDVPAVTAAASRPPLTGKFSADGRRVTLDPAAAGEAGGTDHRREQLAQALPELPEKPLAVGDSFEARVPMRLPSAGGRGDTAIDTRWVYTLRAVDGQRAAFDLRMLLPDASSASLSNGRSLAIAGGAKGTADFDLKDGLFTRIALDADLDLTYGVPMPPGVAAPEATGAAPGAASKEGEPKVAPTPPVLTLKSKLTGPIRIEMGRQAAH